MREPGFSPRSFAIVSHPALPEAAVEAQKIAAVLSALGAAQVVAASLYDEGLRQRIRDKEFDLLIAIGGDGTMLRAGHLCAPLDLPVLGINAGRFGFLMEVDLGDYNEFTSRLLSGQFRLEDRMMLQAHLERNGQVLDRWQVLNEVVVCRGKPVRPIQIEACVDGSPLTSYVADGLIAATPTGSTAYALAAGGPIMPPELRNILLVPLAPHLSVDRAVILAEGSHVDFIVRGGYDPVLSVDGHPPLDVLSDDIIHISAADARLTFVRFQDAGYFYRNLTKYMKQNPAIEKQA
ncbi:MAG: NAD(+)/NADH kinase [Anaerolineaceae bacterium]|nr:NAD(+)/NADH kinase [Anaerolineaceae bacterium]